MYKRDTGQPVTSPREGDLYKVITLHGKDFEIRYGYYEECDRISPYAEPMEIYPDFTSDPLYTADGRPFVTAMQAPCDSFIGAKDENSCCEDCAFYRQGEELIGICDCPKNRFPAETS